MHFFGISIPTLPHGPLSVRQFAPGGSRGKGGDSHWHREPPHVFETLDEEGLQQFAVVPPIEAGFVRLVCLTNAAGDSRSPLGFWELEFT